MVTMAQQAHRFAYLVRMHPEETLEQLMGRMRMPSININVAIWTAVDLNLIEEPDKETHLITFKDEPAAWDFGEIIKSICDMWIYSFTQIGKTETDLEEHYVANWMAGYDTDDIAIVQDYLVKYGFVGRYEIEDGDNTYVFFTGIDNLGKEWGRKQFKKEPIGTLEGDAPIIPENGDQATTAADIAENPTLAEQVANAPVPTPEVERTVDNPETENIVEPTNPAEPTAESEKPTNE